MQPAKLWLSGLFWSPWVGLCFMCLLSSSWDPRASWAEEQRSKHKLARLLETQVHCQSHLILVARAGHISELRVMYCGRKCQITGQRWWIQEGWIIEIINEIYLVYATNGKTCKTHLRVYQPWIVHWD